MLWRANLEATALGGRAIVDFLTAHEQVGAERVTFSSSGVPEHRAATSDVVHPRQHPLMSPTKLSGAGLMSAMSRGDSVIFNHADDVHPLLGALADDLGRLLGGGGQVFFANSGAEANECAMKLARKWAGHGRHVVVSTYGSFHGRTMATLAATGQPAKHEPFAPMPDGYRHVAWADLAHLESAIDETVSAVIIEPIQGEGGVHPADPEYLAGIRRLCDERNLLMILDEVQTGLGRTGEWFGFQHADVAPDVVTMAKALGNGVPISACWAKAEVAAAFQPGDHATTFGGNPLCTAAARATLEVMEDEDVPGKARHAGALLRGALEELRGVSSVRGAGLLLAVELDGLDAPKVAGDLLSAGVIVNAVTPTALRLAPSLLISDDEVAEATRRIGVTLAANRAEVD